MLTLIKKTRTHNGKWYGLYECVCGNQKEIRISAVKSGATKSCGCYRKTTAVTNGKQSATHGQTGTYLYGLWHSVIKHRCEWHTFKDFYEWISPLWCEGLTIEPRDGYYDSKCKLVDRKQLAAQRRKKTCLHKYGATTPLQNIDIKAKIAQTNLKKYGTANASTSNIIKEKTRSSNQSKYGVDYPQQLLKNRQKSKQIMVDKVGFDSEEYATKLGVARSTFNAWVRQYGFDVAINMTKKTSSIEQKVATILHDLNLSFQSNIKVGNYIPDFVIDNVIIEADGLYWHSDAVNSDNTYHRTKMMEYINLGYTPLFFRENEIHNQSLIVSSIIKNKFNLCNRIYARKCCIVTLDNKKSFFNINHLMGVGRGKCYALKYGDDIVCALQFTNRQGVVDISRFCNVLDTTVVGGYSRLINHVLKNEDVHTVQTFVDRRYGSGHYLLTLGFEKSNEDLSFVWTKNTQVYHRLKFRSNSGYKYGYHKLWDCGQAKYIKKPR